MADDLHIIFRTCSKCGVEKPATDQYFQEYQTIGGKKHLRRTCRICRGCKRDGATPYKKGLSPEELREKNRIQSRESHARHRAARLAKMRENRKLYPEKYKEWDHQNYIKNKAGTDYNARRYARRDKEKARDELRAWKKRNPDKVREMWVRTYHKHKAKHYERSVRWQKQNPESVAASRDRRRAREFGAEGNYTREDIRELLKVNGRICFYCSGTLKKFHADHFIPLARGGTNSIENIRLSCPACNLSKSFKMPWEWKPDKFREQDFV